MARVLVIQFRNSDKATLMEQQSINREIDSSVDTEFLSALAPDVCWNNPALLLKNIDGVIFGGSGDFDFDGGRQDDDVAKTTSYLLLKQLSPLLDYIFCHDVPTLGICYGHQIIGAYAGANVVNDIDQKKSCSHPVNILVNKDDYAIFANVPDSFFAHYGHKDSLDRVPESATLLMQGGMNCKVSALCYRQNIYTTQFHPELNFSDMMLRIEASPGYLPEGVVAEEVFKKDPHSNTILQNFGALVAEINSGK